MASLSALLERVAAYSSLLKQQMERVKTRRRTVAESNDTSTTKPKSGHGQAKKRMLVDTKENAASSKRAKVEDATQNCKNDEDRDSHAFVQPVLITGAKLRDYQLEGVAWMAGLYNNGISGILGMSSVCQH